MSCGPIDLPDVVAEVRKVHDKYEAALSRNDLDALDVLFWRNAKTIRFGPNGTLIGHASISAFRRGRRFKELRRVVLAQYITTFGRDLPSPIKKRVMLIAERLSARGRHGLEQSMDGVRGGSCLDLAVIGTKFDGVGERGTIGEICRMVEKES